jgi:hypothetical protein
MLKRMGLQLAIVFDLEIVLSGCKLNETTRRMVMNVSLEVEK